MLILSDEGKNGDSPGKGSEGRRRGHVHIGGSERQPVPLQHRKGGGARLGAGSSRGLQGLEGFSVHPMSNEGKGKPVNDSHQEWGEKRSHLLSVGFFNFCLFFIS